jgi:hypothetical protein
LVGAHFVVVLHRALTGRAEHAADARMIAAGRLEEKAGALWPTQRAETPAR